MAEDGGLEDLEKMYEEMFAYRYTSEDPDYQETISKPIPHCPCVTGYFTRSKRNFDNRDNRNQGGRGRGHWGHRGRGHWEGHGNRYRDDRGQGEGYNRGYGQNRHGNRHYEGRRYNPY